MTGEERAALRALIDKERRERIKRAGCYSDSESEERSQRTRESHVMRHHALVLLKALAATLGELEVTRGERDRFRNMLQIAIGDTSVSSSRVLKYRSDEERLEARRRTWRESKRRASQAQSIRYTA